jgi:hypothetical protein
MPRGSAPGERRGGRKKGTPNKVTAARQAAVAESGLRPLDYLLAVMRDEGQPPQARLDAAKAAAPYVHPRLAAIEHSGEMAIVRHEDALAMLDLDLSEDDDHGAREAA